MGGGGWRERRTRGVHVEGEVVDMEGEDGDMGGGGGGQE